jgi:glutamate synthase (ferredoxin)
MVLLYRLRYPEEIEFVKDLVFRHAELTGSARARKVLVEWDYFVPRFVRVVPNDYNRVLQAQRKMRETGLSPEEAEMAAFELNVADVARVGGK